MDEDKKVNYKEQTIIVMKIFFSIVLGIFGIFTLWILLYQINEWEAQYDILSKTLYSLFYQFYSYINGIVGSLLFVTFWSFIPLVITGIYILLKVISAYLSYKKEKGKRILKTILLVSLTIILMIVPFKMFFEYCFTTTYEIQVNKEKANIENDNIVKLLDGIGKNTFITKIIIARGFPDDYIIRAYYMDGLKEKTQNMGYVDDSGVEELIKNEAVNLTKKVLSKCILIQILGLIIGIYTARHIIKEYRILLEQNEEIKKIQLSKKQKRILLSILVIFLIGMTIMYIVRQINVRYEMNEGKSTKDITYNKDDTKYINGCELPVVYEHFTTSEEGHAVCMGDPAMGTYAVMIYATIDGGSTWKQVNDNFFTVHYDTKFKFINEEVGFFIDYGRKGTDEITILERTEDGGKTWQEVKIEKTSFIEENNLLFKDFPEEKENKLEITVYTLNHAKTPSQTYYIYESEDLGKSWSYKEKSN